MAVIKSGAGTDQWTIDPTSKAGRVTLYDTAGNPITTLPVSVANFPVTQPISGNVNVSNFPVTQNVSGVFWQATQPVSGVFWQATQNVSVLNFPATQPISVAVPLDTQELSANLAVSATGASGAAVTATLPAVVAASHLITLLEITKYAIAAITGIATPVVVTSTNLPGNPAWTFETAQVIGSQVSKVFVPAKSFKSLVPNTATTIVCPATTSVIWRVNVWYLAD